MPVSRVLTCGMSVYGGRSSSFHCLLSSEIKGETERAAQLKITISSYPEPVVIVMRYLFAFLHQ